MSFSPLGEVEQSSVGRQVRLVPASFTGDLWVARHQTKGGKPTGYVYVRGWRQPIPNWANVIGPPARGAPLYGPRAAEYVRELWRMARKKPRIHIGAPSQLGLLSVVRGDTPLTFVLWTQTREYIERRRKEQARAADVAAQTQAVVEHRAPMRVQLGGLGRGLAVKIGAAPAIAAPAEADAS